MSKYRKDAKVDENQPGIVEDLRALPGIQVEVEKDDILVGYKNETTWVEIKSMDTWKKVGGLKAGTFKDSQLRLMKNWTGKYIVAWTTEQILHEIGYKPER